MRARWSTWVAAAVVVVASLGLARPAAAEPLGTRGQVILGGERLVSVMGYESFKSTQTQNGRDVTTTNSQFDLALSGASPLAVTLFTVPRLGIDYAVVDHFTIGASLLAWTTLSRSADQSSNGSSVSTSQPKATLLGIAPRAGYVLNLGESVSFWPRAGFSFAEIFSGGTTNTSSQLAIDLEAPFVLSPADHFGITLGPLLDIPLTGSQSTTQTLNGTSTSVSHDTAQLYVGVAAGLVGWF